MPSADNWLDGRINVNNLDGTNGFRLYGDEWPSNYAISSSSVLQNVGDVNGDGRDDFITADYNNSVALCYFGSEGGASLRFMIDEAPHAGLGYYYGSGDINSDGYSDIFLSWAGDGFWIYGRADSQTEGTAADETLTGANGYDVLRGYDGNDILRGGAWGDRLEGGAGNDTLNGGAGDDTMLGGTGDDTYIVHDTGDIVTEYADEGTDTVISAASEYTLPVHVEVLRLSALAGQAFGTGNASANTLVGNHSANVLWGAGGDDTIYGYGGDDSLLGEDGDDDLYGHGGADLLVGGAGADDLFGGTGIDTLTGDAGADRFHIMAADLNLNHRSIDIITDFSQSDGDLIDFTAFDANRVEEGQQGFDFIGTAAFSRTAGELRYTYDAANDLTLVYGDTDGDGRADVTLRLWGQITLSGSDFDLLVPS